jgi:hypothetical protein
MATTFQFVPETHTYLDEGRVVTSVTQILECAGLVCYDHIPKAILDHKAEVGTAAHAATHYFDEGDLKLSTVDAEVMPYLEAWIRFREESHFVIHSMEQRGIAITDGMKYGYTFDRDGLLNDRPTLLEIKCTAGVEVSWGPQMAAYEMALRAQDGHARHRVAVHLKPNGTYSLIKLGEIKDYQVFRWALGLEIWKQTKGRGYGYGSVRRGE